MKYLIKDIIKIIRRENINVEYYLTINLND